jgi:CHAT domain-containing protein
MERGKARAMLDMLAGQPLAFKGTTVAEIHQDYPLFQWFRERLPWEASADDVRRAREDFLARIAGQPRYQEVASLSAVQPVRLEQLQDVLGPEDLLVEYFVTSGDLLAAVISSTDLDVLKLAGYGHQSLRQNVEAYRQLLQDPASDYQALARLLGRELLQPALEKHDQASHLCIVPGGPLHYLPFEALMLPDGQFVTEKYLVTYATSASALVYALDRRRAASSGDEGQTLVVADPRPRADYAALPGAAVEGELLHRIAPQPKRLLPGQEATESKIIEELKRTRFFHFAGHTEMSPATPMRTALLCNEDVDHDGRFEIREIFELNLRDCQLAVLSACETRLGHWSDGDEIVGLERAFLRAGIPTVVASLWKVEDAATSLLMQEFYTNLWQRKLPRGEALRRAQLAVLRRYDPKTSALRGPGPVKPIVPSTQGDARDAGSGQTKALPPFYWAGFVLNGDWR